MAGIRSKKLSASTLVEVLISMVIIMAVFVTGIAIYVNVTRSGYSVSRLKAQRKMENLVQQSILDKDWQNSDLVEDSIDYHKTVRPFPGYADLIVIEVEAKQNSSTLCVYKQVTRQVTDEN